MSADQDRTNDEAATRRGRANALADIATGSAERVPYAGGVPEAGPPGVAADGQFAGGPPAHAGPERGLPATLGTRLAGEAERRPFRSWIEYARALRSRLAV